MGKIMKTVIIYDNNLKKIADLENAHNITYDLAMNRGSKASFMLPGPDEKNQLCQGGYYAEIFDYGRRIGLFRISNPKRIWDAKKDAINYICEDVLCTLLDDLLFGNHSEIGGVDGTSDAINYILSQQTMPHWQLGTCDFSRNFVYEFENIDLLNALKKIPAEFGDVYLWEPDTTSYPWTLNLKQLSTKSIARIYYKTNLMGLERNIDYAKIYNKIYALGAGEGVNQLTIESVEPSGKKYVEDAASVAKYGVRQYILADRRYTNAENLYSAALNLLEKHKDPYVTYLVDAADISSKTGKDWDYFTPGSLVLVKNYDMRTPVKVRVRRMYKKDVTGKPWEVVLFLDNQLEDFFESNIRLIRELEVEQIVSQGATNVYGDSVYENADSSNPAVIRFYISEDAINVNKCILRLRAAAYRAYTKTTKSGGSSSPTSESGGVVWDKRTGYTEGSGYHTGFADGSVGDHQHSFFLPSHQHAIFLDPHTHEVDIPSHSHSQNYAIYESTTAVSLTIKVDSNTLSESGTSYDELDIVPYLSKNSDGAIVRGWHTVEITPDKNSRIEANIYVQAYIQSRGIYVK